jgi:hypothetical protein
MWYIQDTILAIGVYPLTGGGFSIGRRGKQLFNNIGGRRIVVLKG